MGIAEEMGAVLQNTAASVNIKERLDFSCALFNGRGDLIANAPHIPVHLGSMSDAVRALIADRPEMGPGDVFASNNPYRGGTHLPDITVMRPVFAPGSTRPDFFVAARGHHADIGGRVPGSAPADSTSVTEEVLLDNVILVGRCVQEDGLREQLASGPGPANNPDQNLADLLAPGAACEPAAAQDLVQLCQTVGSGS
ncbi:MAG: hydantoinase B/oxoprolinase family protein [Planctomycetota bacterium]